MHLLVGFQGVHFGTELKSLIDELGIGGIVLFRRNVQDPDQLGALLKEMQDYARKILGRPLWVAIDQEGGPVQRLTPPFTQLPSAQDLADQGPEGIIEWSARAAQELQKTGIQINLAPVLDVITEGMPHFMDARSLGSDPRRVAELGRLWIEGLQGNGVSATAKHYPGLGKAQLDPHHFSPVIEWASEEAMLSDLLPFETAIQAGVHCVMTSHARYISLDPLWPATLSPKINSIWLRERLGFSGVLLSDDMDMAAVAAEYTCEEVVRQGLLATIDFFLLCQRPESVAPFLRALSKAIDEDAVLKDLHRRSLARIQRLFTLHGIDVSLSH